MLILLLLSCIALLIIATTRYKVHPFLALLVIALLFGLCAGMPVSVIIESVNTGFGGTLGSIGIVILLGVMIGVFLEETGGAKQLANAVLKMCGEKNIPLGMSLVGWIVSIPVFVDSGFVLLSSLNKAITRKANLPITLTVVALATGLFASHSMVPPTPGPIAAAGILNADLGLVIFWGMIISLLSIIAPLLYAYFISKRVSVDIDHDNEIDITTVENERLPSITRSILPIFIPISLIMIKSFTGYFNVFQPGVLKDIVDFIGTPAIALLFGLFTAFFLPAKWDNHLLSDQGWIGKAIRDASVIILITGAGGSFGKILQNSDLPQMLGEVLSKFPIGIWLPFLIASALKLAQGSSTVAMITTASIVAPLTMSLGLNSDLSLALSVLAIGAGSTVVSHAPDSYFWIVTQMSGMTVSQGYKTHTVASGLLGLSAMLLIYFTHLLFT